MFKQECLLRYQSEASNRLQLWEVFLINTHLPMLYMFKNQWCIVYNSLLVLYYMYVMH